MDNLEELIKYLLLILNIDVSQKVLAFDNQLSFTITAVVCRQKLLLFDFHSTG